MTNTRLALSPILVLSLAAALLAPAAGIASEEGDAKVLFVETHKCNMCHAVPAAEIESKTKSEKMKGADLGGKVDVDIDTLAAFMRGEKDLDGKNHKKPFKGTDEELQAIVDWLGSLEAQE